MAQTINIYTNHMYGIKYQGAVVTVCVCVCVEGDGVIIIIYYTEHYYNSTVMLAISFQLYCYTLL